MSSERLKIGVIGTGYGADVHIPGLRNLPDVDVVAVCANRIDHAVQVAHRFQIPQQFDDYREMLRRGELDAVTIAVPPAHQHQITIACAEHSVHVLCEKPMGASAAEARDMYRLVEDAGVKHAVDFQSRYHPSFLRFKLLIDKGYIGELESVTVTGYRLPWRVRRINDPGWTDDGERSAGLLNAVGSEYVDTLRWCFGEFEGVSGAVTVSPSDRSRKHPRESSFSILLRFASGASGAIHVAGTSAVGLGDEIVASGEDGLLVLQSDGKLFGTRRGEHQRIEEIPVSQFDQGTLESVPDPRILPFIVLASDWVRRILLKEEYGRLPSFYDGMKVQEVLHGVQRSERLSRWIDLSGKKWPVQW